MTVLRCALLDLLRDRVFFFCNVAVLFGVLLPILILIGVKGGVYSAMIGQLRSDPATLRIDTAGNVSLPPAEVAALRAIPGVRFAIGRTRSFFDAVTLRAEGSGQMGDAVILPTDRGDPFLPEAVRAAGLGPEQIAVSPAVAAMLGLRMGDAVLMVTQGTDRPRQLGRRMTVAAILAGNIFDGRTILVAPGVADAVEAFYEGFAVPEFGITEGNDPARRLPAFEAVRVIARDLTDVAPVEAQMRRSLGVDTVARTARIASTLALGRGLDLALAFIGAAAGVGLVAALGFAFWSSVERKKDVLAILALLGMSRLQIALFPVIQSVVTSVCGVAVAFAGYLGAGTLMGHIFAAAVPEGYGLVRFPPGLALVLGALVVTGVALVALAAGLRAARIEPARVLRAEI